MSGVRRAFPLPRAAASFPRVMTSTALASPDSGATAGAPADARPLAEQLFPAGPLPARQLASEALPAPVRPQAAQSVLDITEFFGATSGGIRTYLLEKAKYVEARPALRQVLVVPGEADAITEARGVRCYRLKGAPIPGQAPYRLMLGRRAIHRIIAHEAPAVIEVGSAWTVPWLVRGAAREAGIPLAYFYHSNVPRLISPVPERDGLMRTGLASLLWRYARRLDRMFDVTIATSKFSERELRGAGIDRVVRVPLGADLDTFTPARRAARDETRRRHGLPVDAPVAGFVGRFAMEKELDVLVEAWREVERRTGAWLVLIGDGPKRKMLQRLAEGRRVRLLPYQSTRPALADLHAALDLYIAPNPSETFGLSSLESLASGTPLLAADRGGAGEQAIDSAAGRTFESGSAASLAREAIAMLGMDAAVLGANGRAYCEREHAWPHVFDRLFAVYHDLRRA